MTRNGSGTGQRRRTDAQAREAARALTAEPVAAMPPGTGVTESEALLLHDVAVPLASGGQRGLRLGRSFAGAVVGTMLVVGLAFGGALGPGGGLGPRDAGGMGGLTAGHAAQAGADEQAGENEDGRKGEGGDGKAGQGEWAGPGATAKPDGGDDGSEPTEAPGDGVKPTDEPDLPEPTEKPAAPDPTKKPAPDATTKPTEEPGPTKDPAGPIALEVAIRESYPKLAWGSCDGLGFDVYKVVRSSDSSVSWPAGDGDEVIAAVGPDGDRRAYDKNAPHGAKAWYRVFCVRKSHEGYKVVTASATKGIEVPEEPTPPDPISLEIDWSINGEGKLVLTWEACEVDGFAFYKVVRSTTNDDPSYLPWTDGTDVIGVVDGMHATEWHAWAPGAGQAAWFRVQCLGYVEGMKVLLGETAAVAITSD